jgi:hypothetical protein
MKEMSVVNFGFGEGVGVGVGVGATVGTVDGEELGLDVVDGLGFGIATPLFQTNFLPLFTHVNFLPLAVAVVPTFLQVSPDLTAAIAFIGTRNSAAVTKAANNFFM